VKDGLLIREQISVRSGYTIVGTFADAAVPTATFRTKVWPATGIIFEQAGQSTRHSRLVLSDTNNRIYAIINHESHRYDDYHDGR